MLDRSVCIAQELAFDDAGMGAITITLGDTPGMDGQYVCLEEGRFWHSGRSCPPHLLTAVCELEDLLVLIFSGSETVLVPKPGRCKTAQNLSGLVTRESGQVRESAQCRNPPQACYMYCNCVPGSPRALSR
jgi:hypothetical protein